MLRRMVLSFLMIFVLITSTVFAEDVKIETFQVQPDRIVLNSDQGAADTIKFSFDLVACNGVEVEVKVEDASISFNGIGEIDSTGSKYCAIDDILHIYFDKEKVIEVLRGPPLIVGDVDVLFLTGYIQYYTGTNCDVVNLHYFVDNDDYGTVEVINPGKKEPR